MPIRYVALDVPSRSIASPALDRLGERHRVVEAARRLGDDAHHGAALRIEHAGLDESRVHDRVEPRVVDDVVDVPVRVVVQPARRDRAELAEVGARRDRRSIAHGGSLPA